MNKPQGTIVHVTGMGACLCTECATTTTHYDVVDDWLLVEDPPVKVILDGSSLDIICEGCNQTITERAETQ